jgi:hypothetical protein
LLERRRAPELRRFPLVRDRLPSDRDVEEDRRERELVGLRVRPAEAVDRDRPAADRAVRGRPEELLDFRLELDREPGDFVSPFSRRILLTVRAATSSARPPYRPDFFALCLMCWYCRSRFGLAPRGMRSSLPNGFRPICYCYAP